MNNLAFHVQIAKSSKEDKNICFCNQQGKLLVYKMFLENLERLSHWLVCQT